MADRLKSLLNVTALAPGGSVVLAHGLKVRGRGRKPDEIAVNNGDLNVTASTETTVTVENTGASPVTGSLLCEVWHSLDRSIGGARRLSDEPFVARGGGGGGGGSSSFVANPTALTGSEDTPLTGNVLTNVSSPTGTLSVQQFTVAGVGGEPGVIYAAGETATIAGRGTVVVNANGTVSATPSPNFFGGFPSISVWVTNGTELRFTTLTITFNAVNDGPVANGAYGLSFNGEYVDVDLSRYATDPDGDTLMLTELNGAPAIVGQVNAISGGTYEYRAGGGMIVRVTPTNGDPASITLSYEVSDGALTATSTITVQVGVDNIPLFSPFAPLLSNTIDQAYLNFSKTFRHKWGPTDDNGVNVAAPPYASGQGYFPVDANGAPTDREPWLYDPATTLWILAKRTSDAALLAEAMNLARSYMAGVAVNNGLGTFTIIGTTGGDPTDVKYLYAPIAWWYEYETLAAGGTTQEAQVYRPRAEALYRQTLQSFTQTYNAGTAELWTERNAWASIMNCLAWYWISGSETALADATAYVEDILTMSAASGVPLHTKDKHEQDGDPTQIISPWMLALLAEAMLQFYRTTGDARIVQWLSDAGDWLLDHAFYTATGAEEPELAGLAGLPLPAYLVSATAQYAEGEAADMQHTIDVGGLMQKVRWAKLELAQSVTAVDDVIAGLDEAAAVYLAYFTRFTPSYPKYRNNPPRSWAWRNRCRYSSVISAGVVPFPPSLTTAPVVTGSTQQGSTLTCSTGVWAGNPAPTYAYQWRRNGVNIGGATNSTYVTQAPDVGTAVDCVVTATNAGGSASSDSNNISVVPAGSPEITAHPSSTSKIVGQTATFTVTATGTPSPTYQWQVSTNNGVSWANVAEGTGGTTASYTTETLAADDDGDQYRCVVTNAGGSVTSNPATLTMVVQQAAVRFTSGTGYGNLTHSFGSAGYLDWTVGFWCYLEAAVNNGVWAALEGVAGRTAYVQYNNSGVASLGDSNTGTVGGGWDVAPPLNTWFFVVWRGPTSYPGTFSGRWYNADGSLGGTASRANGIENSVAPQVTRLNGGGVATGFAMRAQYVRAYNRRLTDGEADAEITNIDMGTSGLQYFNVFENNGGGGVAVRDASGNNRVFTLTNGTLSVDGPTAPSV